MYFTDKKAIEPINDKRRFESEVNLEIIRILDNNMKLNPNRMRNDKSKEGNDFTRKIIANNIVGEHSQNNT